MKSDLLEIKPISYPKSLLDNWIQGDYSFLTSSKASRYIKDILISKAMIRPSRRFFGEAYIASKLGNIMVDGWYNSFKWLTADKWLSGKNLEPRFEKPFYRALHDRIGTVIIQKLQGSAEECYSKYKDSLQHKRPVAPDLWVVDKNGEFLFIESKMEGDYISPHQLVGLALIKKFIRSSVSIWWLYQADKAPPSREVVTNHIETFSLIYRSV